MQGKFGALVTAAMLFVAAILFFLRAHNLREGEKQSQEQLVRALQTPYGAEVARSVLEKRVALEHSR